MKRNIFLPLVGILVIIGVFVAVTCTYVVDEREQVVVTRFSKPVRIIVGDRTPEELQQLRKEFANRTDTPPDLRVSMGAGLRFKMPFIDHVEKFPDTLIEYDAEPERIITRDKKVLIVDNFARWRIENPLLYRIRVQTEVRARERLDDIIYAYMREELGKNNLIEVIRTTNNYINEVPDDTQDLTADNLPDQTNPMKEKIERGREDIMEAVLKGSDARARSEFGIHIIDVRIKRADLVEENLNAVFGRMRAERDRVSKAYESEGEKEAQIIRSETDKKVQVMLAEAQRDAQKMRGEADAQVTKMYGDAFGAEPALYKYMRSLEVLKESMPVGSELVVGLDSGIMKVLKEEEDK